MKVQEKLTPKEERFVEEYTVDFNGLQAYLRAGYSSKSHKSASVCAHNLLAKPNVAAAVRARMKLLAEKAGTDSERMLLEAMRVALTDPRKVFDENGKLLQIHEMPDDIAACIASFDVEEMYDGQGDERKFVGYRTKLRFWNKNVALDQMFRFFALYKDLGTKENPFNVNLNNIQWHKLSLEDLARFRKQPELLLTTALGQTN